MTEGIRPARDQSTHAYTQTTQSNLNPQEQKIQATVRPGNIKGSSKIGFRASKREGNTAAAQFIAGKRELFSAFVKSIKSLG